MRWSADRFGASRLRARSAQTKASGPARTDRARIFPTGYITGNGEKKVTRPARAYADGRTQELPAWREWLAG